VDILEGNTKNACSKLRGVKPEKNAWDFWVGGKKRARQIPREGEEGGERNDEDRAPAARTFSPGTGTGCLQEGKNRDEKGGMQTLDAPAGCFPV